MQVTQASDNESHMTTIGYAQTFAKKINKTFKDDDRESYTYKKGEIEETQNVLDDGGSTIQRHFKFLLLRPRKY